MASGQCKANRELLEPSVRILIRLVRLCLIGGRPSRQAEHGRESTFGKHVGGGSKAVVAVLWSVSVVLEGHGRLCLAVGWRGYICD